MGIYFSILVIMVLFAVQMQNNPNQLQILIGYIKINYYNLIYIASVCVLLYIAAFSTNRSGDYFVYNDIYEAAPLSFDFFSDYIKNFHTEIGWKLCCIFFKQLGFSFKMFIGMVSVISMVFINRFIQIFCSGKRIFALLWIYTSFYLVYFYIGIRACLVITIFLSFMLPYLIEKGGKKRIFKYVFLTVFCSMFHSVGWIFLLAPLVLHFKSNQLEKIFICLLVINFPLYYTGFFQKLLELLPMKIQEHFMASETNIILQLGYRMMFIILVYYCYRQIQYTKENEVCYKLYLMGSILFVFFLSIPTLNVRLFDVFKNLEIPIITSYLTKNKKINVMFLLILSVCFFMYIYHMSEIQIQCPAIEGRYNVFNCPIVITS